MDTLFTHDKHGLVADGWLLRFETGHREVRSFEFFKVEALLSQADPPDTIGLVYRRATTVLGIINTSKKIVEIEPDGLRKMGLATYEFQFKPLLEYAMRVW